MRSVSSFSSESATHGSTAQRSRQFRNARPRLILVPSQSSIGTRCTFVQMDERLPYSDGSLCTPAQLSYGLNKPVMELLLRLIEDDLLMCDVKWQV